ncbi:MAG: putative ABC transporter ATP-binding protein [Methanoregulaceae archaeon PtaU1.Bin059]|nr:MAG: putative ABC transporter ATP-binding protein [Methanoregulaceae archaeon PtaB.Bin152]OPY42299.1 MAG: putative ABC transporter ATP-binding protein [Methanoregulaceae archaeon PtaU1.Bin059]
MIIGRDLTRIYGMGAVQVRALDGVSVEIQKGDFVGIMGPSGSGKSTLLHMFGLLDRPTSGTIIIDGVDAGTLDERARTQFRLRRLGYVFQDYALVPELTAKENVYLPSMARGMTAQECTLACSEILTLVGLGNRIHHLPGEMSGGEQQRVAIARALVNRPTLLLADEPCANLDSQNSKIILDLFQRLNRDLHQTIVMVSHEEWHKRYFDRIISMKDGVIEEEVNRNEGGELTPSP